MLTNGRQIEVDHRSVKGQPGLDVPRRQHDCGNSGRSQLAGLIDAADLDIDQGAAVLDVPLTTVPLMKVVSPWMLNLRASMRTRFSTASSPIQLVIVVANQQARCGK